VNDDFVSASFNPKSKLGLKAKNKLDKGKRNNISKPIALYCLMTFCIMLLFLAFAASEIFSIFFSEGNLGGVFLSKLFGADGTSGMGFSEMMLSQSFSDLSYWKGNNNSESLPDNEATDKNNVSKPPQNDNIISDPEVGDPEEDAGGSPKDEEDNNEYTPSNVPDGMKGIVSMDLSLIGYGIDYVNNQSSQQIYINELKDISVSVDVSKVYPADSPLVLIIHTHGTEAFMPEGVTYYDPKSEIARSDDININVVFCGKVMAEILNQEGIPTIHCDIMHDAKGYTGSYDRSAETIKEYLKKYPSIQYVIDLHRDAIVNSSGELIKPVAFTENGTSAQIMCVVGTGLNSGDSIYWQKNLALAQRFRERLNAQNKKICRPTCLRDSSYNQQYSVYSLLIELGAAGNTQAEAVLATKTAAYALAAVIKGL